MKEELLKSLRITPTQLKIFLGSMIAMFIMTVLQYLGIHSPIKFPKLVIPTAQKADIMDSVRPKLEQKQPTFDLKKKTSFVTQTYAAETQDFDNARAYAVVDLDTGDIIAEKNGTAHLPIASLTKIMSAVVSLDLSKPSDVFTVTQKAANMEPTKIGVQPGQKLTLEELLNGALLTSGNDAAEEIRDGVDAEYKGNIFVDAMNEKASFLGLTNSHFTNPQGLDYGDNYSSAEDLAKLSQYALANYPIIASIARKDYQFLPANGNHPQFDLYNWNGLIGVYPGAQGLKIGNTDAAGYTTVVEANRDGKRVLAVVLGAPDILKRDMWAAELLDLGFNKTLGLAPINVTEDQFQAKYSTWQYWN